MRALHDIDALDAAIAASSALLVYVSQPDCGICTVMKPRIEALDRPGLDQVSLDASHVPEVAGRLVIFSVPAVLLFIDGKEVHRQARFLDIPALENLLAQALPLESEPRP